MTNNNPLQKITIERSQLLAWVLVIASSLTLITAITLLPWYLALFVMLGVIWVAWAEWRMHVNLQAERAIVIFEYGDTGNYVTTRRGHRLAVEVQSSSFVHPSLTVLNMRDNRGHYHHLVLAPDRVDAEAYRALRVRLNAAAI